MDKFRILFVGDPSYPISNTGFGIATAKIIEGLVKSERFRILHLPRGMLAHHVAPKDLPFTVYVPPVSDPNGWHYCGTIADWENPHLIIFESDPQSISEWRKNTQVRRVPNLVHCPVEGAPLLRPWADEMKMIQPQGRITCYTEFARQALYSGMETTEHPIEVLGLGLDHANFRKYAPAERNRIRALLGWTDKFVVMNVARNAGRKMLPRLMDAMQIVHASHPEALLYLHTQAFENFYLGGHNLLELRRQKGMEDYCFFYQKLRDAMQGIPYEANPPDDPLGLIDFYNAADLFVSVSGAEGFNLPNCEAAACGLPVMAPMYSGGWEVAQHFARGIPVDNFETHPSGTRMAAVRPQMVADCIMEDMENRDLLAERARNGQAYVQRFKWQPTVDRLVELAIELCEKA